MGNTVPSLEMQALLASPEYSSRCKWLEGSLLVESDLVRCDATKAICTFIFCDKTATSSEDVYAEVSTMRPPHLTLVLADSDARTIARAQREARSYVSPALAVVEHKQPLRHIHIHTREQTRPRNRAVRNNGCTGLDQYHARHLHYQVCIRTDGGDKVNDRAAAAQRKKQTSPGGFGVR